MNVVKSYIEARDKLRAARESFFATNSDADLAENFKQNARVEALRKPISGLIDCAWIVYYELHVDDQTFCVHKIVYGADKAEARSEFAKLRSEHGDHYHLQLKGGPFKLTENFYMMEEI